MVMMSRRRVMAMAMGMEREKLAVPAIAKINNISWVAYAVEERASEANTAKPTFLVIAWWAAAAVSKGRPMSMCEIEGVV
jgi:hypothetical protein